MEVDVGKVLDKFKAGHRLSDKCRNFYLYSNNGTIMWLYKIGVWVSTQYDIVQIAVMIKKGELKLDGQMIKKEFDEELAEVLHKGDKRE